MGTRKIILVGKAATGKNYVAERMENSFFYRYRTAIYDTTRPKRINEVDGVDYFFKSKIKMFFSLSENVIKTKFNGWRYNLTKKEYKNSNLIICSPEGTYQLLKKYGKENLYIVYLVEQQSIRFKRLSERNSEDTVYRRMAADMRDFMNFHLEADFICKSTEYGRIMANGKRFLETGEKKYSLFNYPL
jgi:guanylate kinase